LEKHSNSLVANTDEELSSGLLAIKSLIGLQNSAYSYNTHWNLIVLLELRRSATYWTSQHLKQPQKTETHVSTKMLIFLEIVIQATRTIHVNICMHQSNINLRKNNRTTAREFKWSKI